VTEIETEDTGAATTAERDSMTVTCMRILANYEGISPAATFGLLGGSLHFQHLSIFSSLHEGKARRQHSHTFSTSAWVSL